MKFIPFHSYYAFYLHFPHPHSLKILHSEIKQITAFGAYPILPAVLGIHYRALHITGVQ